MYELWSVLIEREKKKVHILPVFTPIRSRVFHPWVILNTFTPSKKKLSCTRRQNCKSSLHQELPVSHQFVWSAVKETKRQNGLTWLKTSIPDLVQSVSTSQLVLRSDFSGISRLSATSPNSSSSSVKAGRLKDSTWRKKEMAKACKKSNLTEMFYFSCHVRLPWAMLFQVFCLHSTYQTASVSKVQDFLRTVSNQILEGTHIQTIVLEQQNVSSITKSGGAQQ